MKQAAITIKYDEEKLGAIKQYMGKKDADFEAEMNEVLGKLYEKFVPQAVREYIDSRGEVPPAIKKTGMGSAKNGSATKETNAEKMEAVKEQVGYGKTDQDPKD